MKKRHLTFAALFGLGVLTVACSDACFNPTGYCGPSTTPKSDRVGGPLWFRSATQTEKLAFYREECDRNPTYASYNPSVLAPRSQCVSERMTSARNTACLYHYSPTLSDPAVDAKFKQCMAGRWPTQ